MHPIISPQAAGEFGIYQATIDPQVASALPRTFNISVYFVRNGSKIKISFIKLMVMLKEMAHHVNHGKYTKTIYYSGKVRLKESINNMKGCQSLYHLLKHFIMIY